MENVPVQFLRLLAKVLHKAITKGDVQDIVKKLQTFDRRVPESDYELTVIRLCGYPSKQSFNLVNRHMKKRVKKFPPIVEDAILEIILGKNGCNV
jgi:hypothetical protein